MQSDIGWDYLLALALWALAFAVLLYQAWKGKDPVVGLALAYWCQLALIHLLGGIVQLLPWHISPNRADTLSGFPLTGYAMAGLLLGHFLFRGALRLWAPASRRLTSAPNRQALALGLSCIGAGTLFYFLLARLAAFIPSAGAIVSNGLNLAVAGCCLAWWFYYQTGQAAAAWAVAAGSLMFPVATVLLQGFLGFGVVAVLTLGTFVAVTYTPRWMVIVGGVGLGFVGLSLWSAYAAVRNDIRGVVWGGQSLEDRAAVSSSRLQENWSWFDLDSSQQLDSIEARLNQNSLVGAARREIDAGRVELAEGETLWDAVVALVPRVVWRDKPHYAGSEHLVSRFTGMEFDANTSVGIGHVMELYVNFGEAGVLLGFAVLGALLSTLDFAAGEHLRSGNLEAFLLCYVPGQTLLMVGGVLAEIPPAAVGSVILCLFITRYVMPPGWFSQLTGLVGTTNMVKADGKPIAVCAFPGLAGANAGGVQGSGRIAWRAIAAHARSVNGSAGLLVYGPADGDDLRLGAEPQLVGHSRLSIVRGICSRRWDTPLVCFWHLDLLRLLPALRVGAAEVVLFVHGIEAWRRRDWLTRRLLRRVDRFLTNSRFTWERLLDFQPHLARKPHAVVPLGIGEPAGDVPPPDEAPTVLMLGRLERGEDYKGHREVLAAWPRVRSRLPGASLWIAGDGDLRPDLEALAARDDGSGAVRFWGRVTEEHKQDLLRRCRCLVMPSRGAGFGLVYLEAMRLGRPCLVSDVDAGREVVNPPEAGLAANPSDPEALADAVCRLLAAGPQWQDWSQNARARYERAFTAGHFQRRLVAALFGQTEESG